MSLRLVQYYFQSKAQLMNAALERLERRSHERWAARLEGLEDPSAREVVEALVAEALPTDAESRMFHQAWTSYAVLAMTERWRRRGCSRSRTGSGRACWWGGGVPGRPWASCATTWTSCSD